MGNQIESHGTPLQESQAIFEKKKPQKAEIKRQATEQAVPNPESLNHEEVQIKIPKGTLALKENLQSEKQEKNGEFIKF